MGSGPVLPIISFGLQAFSMVNQASEQAAANRAAQQQAEYNAAIAARNAQAAEQARIRELEISQREEQDQDLTTAAELGFQLAQQGASGLDAGAGSLLSVRDANRVIGRLNTLNIRNRRETSAYDFARQAQSHTDRSQAFQAEASNIGSRSVVPSLLGGLGGLGLKAYSRFAPRKRRSK